MTALSIYSTALTLLVSVSGCSPAQAQGPPFIVVSTKASMASKERLTAGTKLRFTFSKSKNNETFLLHRCGNPCNTAKLVQRWQLKVFAPDTRVTAALKEEGKYYFWIQRQLPGGEVGPVFVDVTTSGQNTVKVRYVSGTELTVTRVAPKAR
jgi:hypothetical protein